MNIDPAIKELMRRTMTVSALREALEGFDDEDLIVMSADYGDHSHTLQALVIGSAEALDGSMSVLTPTSYSASGVAIDEDTEVMRNRDRCYRGGGDQGPAVIVLRSERM